MFYISKGSRNDVQINEAIRDKEVRVIGPDGEPLGVMPIKQAMDISTERELDLVRIAPQATPPVCKIMDYGKFLFESSKKEKEQRKNQKIVSLKEIRLSATIDEHDFQCKVKNAVKFLTAGDKVRVTVRFRGREVTYTSLGNKVLMRFAEVCEEIGILEKRPKLEGRSLSIIIAPKVK